MEDPRLQVAQRGAGLESQLVVEVSASGSVDIERLCLAPGAIERKHQQRLEPLARRVPRGGGAQVGDHIDVMAKLEVSLGAGLEHLEPLLLQRRCVRPDCVLLSDSRQSLPAPEREGLIGRLARGQRLTVGECRSGAERKLGEVVAVGAPVGDAQPDPPRPGADQLPVSASGTQCRPDPREVGIDALPRARRWTLGPERVDDRGPGYGLASV
jgi:hypothetical protein